MHFGRTPVLLAAVCAIIVLVGGTAHAYSGFPSPQYPGNQYGFQSTYYSGPWGERMVYGSYGYFPNPYGYRPYGYRTYGHFYTPMDLRRGTTGYGYGWNAYGWP